MFHDLQSFWQPTLNNVPLHSAKLQECYVFDHDGYENQFAAALVSTS